MSHPCPGVVFLKATTKGLCPNSSEVRMVQYMRTPSDCRWRLLLDWESCRQCADLYALTRRTAVMSPDNVKVVTVPLGWIGDASRLLDVEEVMDL